MQCSWKRCPSPLAPVQQVVSLVVLPQAAARRREQIRKGETEGEMSRECAQMKERKRKRERTNKEPPCRKTDEGVSLEEDKERQKREQSLGEDWLHAISHTMKKEEERHHRREVGHPHTHREK